MVSRALSVKELSQRWRVSPKKVRLMLARGLLEAFDLGLAGVGRHQVRISPEAIAKCEQQTLALKPRTRKTRERFDKDILELLET